MSTANTNQMDKTVAEIAARILGVEALTTQHRDARDFHELAVWKHQAGAGSGLRGRAGGGVATRDLKQSRISAPHTTDRGPTLTAGRTPP